MELIQVDINLKNTTHIKLVLVYQTTRITAADDDVFYTVLEEILLKQHECVIMGDFNLPHNVWSLQRSTPATGSKLLQFIADNGLSQHVQEPTRLNNYYYYYLKRWKCKAESDVHPISPKTPATYESSEDCPSP